MSQSSSTSMEIAEIAPATENAAEEVAVEPTVEVAVNGGRASDRFGVREKDIIGMEVEVSKRPGFSRAKREAL